MEDTNTPVVETTETVETTPEVVETVAPATAAADESANVEVPAKFKSIVEAIETMSVLDLNELVKLFEKKFGVSAAAVAVAGPAAAGAAEEKSEFTAVLTSDGGAKIAIMKVVKEALGLGLKEAKDLVDNLPATLKENMKKEDAEALKKQLEDAGGKVELK